MKTMDCNINGAPFEKRLEHLNNRLDKVEDANKREKLVHNIQRLELQQKIQSLKASKNGPRNPEMQLEILATRLDLVKMIANNNISNKKQGNIERRMKIVQDKIMARQDEKKKQRNKEEETTTTADGVTMEKSKVAIKDRLVKQMILLEEEDDPAQRQMIANRIARIKNRIERNEEQRSKRAELQNKIRLFKNLSGVKNLSEEQHLEILFDRLELVKNCPSRRRQIEKRMEMLRVKIASAADANAIECKTMDCNINGAPFEKRLEHLNNRLDNVEDVNKQEKLVHNIQRLELQQKIQSLKASKNGLRTPEMQLEILATRLDLVKMIANDHISNSNKKQGNIEKRMKIMQDKIMARQDEKKKQRNKEEETTTTADRKNNKNSRVTIKHRLVKQKKLLEEEDDLVKRRMIENRIARIKNRMEQNEEQRSKRAELQNKIRLFKNSSGTKKLSEEQRLEILSVRLELVRNCPSRRQQIEKRIEVLQAKIASTADVNAIEREMHTEEESSNEEQKNSDMEGIEI